MDTTTISGPGRQLAAVIPPLRGSGVEVLPVLFQRRSKPESAYAGYLREHGIPFVTLQDSGRGDVRLIGRLASLLRERQPDIVQTHSYRPTTLAWLLRHWRHQPWRWVGFFHGWTNENALVRIYHRLDRRLLSGADRVLVVARPQLKLFTHCAGRVEVIANAMLHGPEQAALDDPGLAGRLSGLPRPRVAVIGRLSPEKGVDLFIQAFARLRHAGMGGSAVIAGDGPERASLAELAVRLGVSDRVIFLGQLPSPQLVYSESELVVLPSRSEGMPNVLLEAMAAGRPVLATAVGAVPDIMSVGGEAVGSMVPSEDAEALALAMQFELGRQPAPGAGSARRRVEARYSLSHRAGVLRRIYNEVLMEAR